MSKLKRLLGALSLVSLFIFSSCVDDSIAPEVTALRQAQVDLLNAEVAYQTAETALLNAQVELQGIINSHTSAINAITQAAAASNLEVTEATNAASIQGQINILEDNLDKLEVQVLTNEGLLLAAQETLDKAQRDFEAYLATAGLTEAAEYIAAWNEVLNGATGVAIVLPGQSDFIVPTGGLFQVQKDIASQKSVIAQLELLYNMSTATLPLGTGFSQQTAIDRANLAVTDAEMTLAQKQATLIAGRAVVEGATNPAAALEEMLLSLAADTIAQQVSIDSLEDVIMEIGALTDPADSIIAVFEGTAPSNNKVTGGATYVLLTDSLSNMTDSLEIVEADLAVYDVYADTLRGIYTTYFADISTISDDLMELRQDTVDASEALEFATTSPAAQELEFDLEEAFAEYVAAERLFKKIITDGGTPSIGDTNTFVTARRDWDGIDEEAMFADPLAGNISDIINDMTTDAFDASTNTFFPLKTGAGDFTGADDEFVSYGTPASKSVFTSGDGGALDDFNQGTNSVALQEDLDEAKFALFQVLEFYEDAVDEFATLDAVIDSIKDGDYRSTLPYSSLIGDLADAGTFTSYKNDIDDAADVLTDDDDGLSDNLSTTPKVDGTDTSFPEGSFTVKDLSDLAEDLEDRSDDVTEDLEDNAPFVAPYLEDYLAAKALVADAADSIAAAKIAPEFALFTAEDALKATVAMMEDVKEQIEAIEDTELTLDGSGDPALTPVVVFVDDQGNEYTSEELTGMPATNNTFLENYLNNILEGPATESESIVKAEQDIEDKQGLVVQAEAGLIELQDLLTIEENELTRLETEETVLQALADAIQELVLAALAG